MSGIVAVVGRPNVGKSTFFNRLTESRQAIVDGVSGVTRDRHYGDCFWNGREFTVVDTGGYVTNSDDVFEEEIRRQVVLAIDEADVVLFVVDVETGITDLDNAVANLLRKTDKKSFLVVNKVDNNARHDDAFEFYNLGLGDYFPISAINGHGTGDLLDAVVDAMPSEEPAEEAELPRISIVGRPNAGKSSFLNALLDEDRFIVTPIAGTTRDAIGTHYKKFGYDLYFVDTAGLRKKSKVHEDLEFYSVLRSVRAIENCDVGVLMIDAQNGLEAQDMSIFNLLVKNSKGVVVVINKWDLVEKGTNTARDYEKLVREKLAPFNDVPIVFTSVLNKQRIKKVLDLVVDVHENRTRKIPTSKLNEVMLEAVQRFHPPSVKGKYIKIKYVTQLPTHSPAFAFFCSNSKYVRESYKRYLENQLRENFNFTGVPIKVFMRDK